MTIDRVHDLQSAFRKIVSAQSRPGTIIDLGPEALKIGTDMGIPPQFLLIALTLLDGETSFAVSSDTSDAHASAISRLTYAPRRTAENAAFVFVPDAASDASDIIDACSPGTLLDPHLGATVIIGATAIRDIGGLTLRGPGIRERSTCEVLRDGLWLAARNMKNAEYPLGIDVIFVTPEAKAIAFPRTTMITESRGVS